MSDSVIYEPGDEERAENPDLLAEQLTRTEEGIVVEQVVRVHKTSYSLDLERVGADNLYVPSRDFPNEVRTGDRFEYEGETWQVVEVAMKQFDAEGEPPRTLRCVIAPNVSE